ncbi:MAG TPA: cytochrome c [Puia sp.]|jgi:mono/diheme cytochrome c family protein|nr:cytochrome c [Puia sp.]
MRPELELIEEIDKYLNDELTAAGRAGFETRLAAEPVLREDLRLLGDIRTAIHRIPLRHDIQTARRHYHRARYLTRWGGAAFGAIVIAAITILSINHAHAPAANQSAAANATLAAGATTHPAAEIYTIDLTKDTTLTTAHGAILGIPRGTFDAGGATSFRLQVKEAYTITEMIRNGLTTRSNGQPLSSGGMIDIEPVDSGTVRILKPVKVSIPADHVEANMRLYKGQPDSGGKINWINPIPLADTSRLSDLAIGRTLFMRNCAACHAVRGEVTGPALAYIPQRRERSWLNKYIRDNQRLMASGDCYSYSLYLSYNKTPMPLYPNLTDKDIDRLLYYIQNQSRLIDSNKVPDYHRTFDSCVLYHKLYDSLNERRQALITANGNRTDNVRLDAAGKPITDTAIALVNSEPVTIEEHPVNYYKFTVESFGWYNVDALLKDLSGVEDGELWVHVPKPYPGEVNVFFIIPGRKVIVEGGLFVRSQTEFCFFTDDGKIPLPAGEQAYVFATGEYKGKPVFAIKGFLLSRSQTIDLQPRSMTMQQITDTVSRLDLNRLSVRVGKTPNFAEIRAIETSLKAIARFRPKDCDCNCGGESWGNFGRDSVGVK